MRQEIHFRQRPVQVCTAPLKPSLPFMPMEERKRHPELLPRVNSALPYDAYFREIQAVVDSFGGEAWEFSFEFAASALLDLERRAQIMAEVMNSFNRSRSGRMLNVSGCRLQCVYARTADFLLRSWSVFRGQFETLHVLSRFLGLFRAERYGVEFEISYHHRNPPRKTEDTYRNLWDNALLSRERWKALSCERIGGSFTLRLRCTELPGIGDLQRLIEYFDDVTALCVPRFGLYISRITPGTKFELSEFETGLPFEFLPFRFMPFVRFGDVHRKHRGTYLNFGRAFKVKRSVK